MINSIYLDNKSEKPRKNTYPRRKKIKCCNFLFKSVIYSPRSIEKQQSEENIIRFVHEYYTRNDEWTHNEWLHSLFIDSVYVVLLKSNNDIHIFEWVASSFHISRQLLWKAFAGAKFIHKMNVMVILSIQL